MNKIWEKLTWHEIEDNLGELYRLCKETDYIVLFGADEKTEGRDGMAQVGSYFCYDGKWIASSNDTASYKTALNEYSHFMLIEQPGK